MTWVSKYHYLRRIFKAYIFKTQSQLNFWHESPGIHEKALYDVFSMYYFMPFLQKSLYEGHFDAQGIPMLNYHGIIGLQYNPIAISQYGLGLINRYLDGEKNLVQTIKAVAHFLKTTLVDNGKSKYVWMHHFDFEYDSLLKAPWYSGLAQGQGISFLLRARHVLKDDSLKEVALLASRSMHMTIDEGGVLCKDSHVWLEEYITKRPSHILNGFIWGMWGLWDMGKDLHHKPSLELFDQLVVTLKENLHCFDNGYWSLYDMSDKPMQNLASPFYHDLHIVQMDIMYRLTGETIFKEYHEKFKRYKASRVNRWRALVKKSIFKIAYF